MAHDVCDDKGCVTAPRRETCRPTKVEAAACNVDLRQPDGLADAVKDAIIGRVELCIRSVGRVKTIESEACLADHVRAEGVRLVQRENLPPRIQTVAEAGDGIAEKIRLSTVVVLDVVVSMQSAVLCQVVAYVPRPLVDLDRSGCRTYETRRA